MTKTHMLHLLTYLVKAFDTADHQQLMLINKILEKYGAPPPTYARLLSECILTSWWQLHSDSLEKIWESKGLEKVQVVHASDEDFENGIGIVRGQTPPKQFESSSTRRYPAYQYSNASGLKKKNAPTIANKPLDRSIVQCVPESAPVEKSTLSYWERREAGAERAKKKAELEKTRYFSLDQTQPIAVKDGFLTFTMHFKYLGSFISYNLWDDFDIDLCIKKEGQASTVDVRENQELIQCMLDPQRELPTLTRPNWGSRDSSNIEVLRIVSLTHLAKDGWTGAIRPKEGRTGRRPPPRELAEKKNLPANNGNGTQNECVGRNLFDSFGVLGLGLDATEMHGCENSLQAVYRM
ncbi:hypothetical protein THAOC_21573 [Thalassiosira oceanica]|uniref:Uncharacterized protein n=1 Tax=Thalassiosira oceanica TaxID=159749 RepID=K0SII8_THAOC|nr:hypothetical protein THAOC_21573 [Thalassiosira oceanica]|eukprot:EJK58317.1 hypothetical protein THAOC_21573 [Thalassiosira oceanica]